MNRRDLLAQIGVTVVIGGFGVCLGDSGIAEAEDSQSAAETPGERDDGRRSDGGQNDENGPFDTEYGEPYERYEIGDSDISEGVRPHKLYVRNDAEKTRDISIRIDRDDEPVFERARELPVGAFLEIVLVEPAVYDVVVEVGGTRSVTTMDREWTGCAWSQTTVTFRAGGIETRTQSVQSGCD